MTDQFKKQQGLKKDMCASSGKTEDQFIFERFLEKNINKVDRRTFLKKIGVAVSSFSTISPLQSLAGQVQITLSGTSSNFGTSVTIGGTKVPSITPANFSAVDNSGRTTQMTAVMTKNTSSISDCGVLLYCDYDYSPSADTSLNDLTFSPYVNIDISQAKNLTIVCGGAGGFGRYGDNGGAGGGGGLAIATYNMSAPGTFKVYAGSRGCGNIYNVGRAGAGSAFVAGGTTVCYATGGIGGVSSTGGSGGSGVNGSSLFSGGGGSGGGSWLNGSAGGAAGTNGNGSGGYGSASWNGVASPGYGGNCGSISSPYSSVVTAVSPWISSTTDGAGGLGGCLKIDGFGDSSRGGFGGGGASTQGGATRGGCGFVWIFWPS